MPVLAVMAVMMAALVSLLTGGARAVLAAEHIEIEKVSAAYQITIQLEVVERLEGSRPGGLDAGRATGRVVEVVRAPRGSSEKILRAGDPVSFRAPVWAWSARDLEPPGPDRLYWGPDASRTRLQVWGYYQGGEFGASAFESKDPGTRDDPGVSVETVLDRLDRITAAFMDTRDDDIVPMLERITGLRLLHADTGTGGLRADIPAEDGWALAAEYRVAGSSRILTVALGGSTCVRRADVTARYGSDARPVPVSPHRTLPAPWRLEYERQWGFMVFGFRMARPHDYDDCLVEVLFRQDI
jgi:hypothetical protein